MGFSFGDILKAKGQALPGASAGGTSGPEESSSPVTAVEPPGAEVKRDAAAEAEGADFEARGAAEAMRRAGIKGDEPSAERGAEGPKVTKAQKEAIRAMPEGQARGLEDHDEVTTRTAPKKHGHLKGPQLTGKIEDLGGKVGK
jgi:hypothetical protein